MLRRPEILRSGILCSLFPAIEADRIHPSAGYLATRLFIPVVQTPDASWRTPVLGTNRISVLSVVSGVIHILCVEEIVKVQKQVCRLPVSIGLNVLLMTDPWAPPGKLTLR